jgi:hypothetical protein
MVTEGKAEAFKWKHHGIVSYDVHVDGRTIKVISLRDVLVNRSRNEQYAALIEYVEWVRSVGANIGSIVGMNYSMWRTTLHKPVDSIGGPRLERLMIGARIEHQKNRGTFYDVNLWDLASAYSSTIGSLQVPRKWEWRTGPFDWDSDGFVQAEVNVPDCFGWGPLGIKSGMSARARELCRVPPPTIRFPTNNVVRGLWTADEIRTAESVGCDIVVTGWWEPIGARPVFADWWQLMLEGREKLSPNAQRILKWGANTLWGRFAANGQTERIFYSEGRQKHERMQREVMPKSAPIAGMIAGKIRARLYVEGIEPFAPFVLSCHTDGVFLPKGLEVSPNGGAPGTWRIKKECDSLTLIDAQTYNYTSGGDTYYVMAGVKKPNAFYFNAIMEAKKNKGIKHQRFMPPLPGKGEK